MSEAAPVFNFYGRLVAEAMSTLTDDEQWEALDIVVTLHEVGVRLNESSVLEGITRAAKRRSIDERAREARVAAVRKTRLHHDSIVYYMRMGNLVKIGTTQCISKRSQTLNPQGVMAVEFGDHRLEGQRHKEFGHLRSHGEWFTLSSEIGGHIVEVRERFELDQGVTVEAWLARHSRPPRQRASSG